MSVQDSIETETRARVVTEKATVRVCDAGITHDDGSLELVSVSETDAYGSVAFDKNLPHLSARENPTAGVFDHRYDGCRDTRCPTDGKRGSLVMDLSHVRPVELGVRDIIEHPPQRRLGIHDVADYWRLISHSYPGR